MRYLKNHIYATITNCLVLVTAIVTVANDPSKLHATLYLGIFGIVVVSYLQRYLQREITKQEMAARSNIPPLIKPENSLERIFVKDKYSLITAKQISQTFGGDNWKEKISYPNQKPYNIIWIDKTKDPVQFVFFPTALYIKEQNAWYAKRVKISSEDIICLRENPNGEQG